MANTQSGKPERLFKTTPGTVSATVYGPTIGFLWAKVEYCRYVQSTKEPGKREKRQPNRETDQIHLERCVKEVRAWFRQRWAIAPSDWPLFPHT